MNLRRALRYLEVLTSTAESMIIGSWPKVKRSSSDSGPQAAEGVAVSTGGAHASNRIP
jgi:hypothetical protein